MNETFLALEASNACLSVMPVSDGADGEMAQIVTLMKIMTIIYGRTVAPLKYLGVSKVLNRKHS